MQFKPLSAEYISQAISLYEQAFPIEERRESSKWIALCKNNPHFHIQVITDDKNTFVGIITHWDFRSFIYIEHFAISSSLRNKGYGSKVISFFVNQFSNIPIILEVELPHTPIAIKRIDFYKRHHFELLPYEYKQPPYRHNEKEIPLKIMCLNTNDISNKYADFVKTIHQEVYNVKRNKHTFL